MRTNLPVFLVLLLSTIAHGQDDTVVASIVIQNVTASADGSVTFFDYSSVTEVTGHILINNNENVEIDLSNVLSVGTYVSIQSEIDSTVRLDSLESVGTWMRIYECQDLAISNERGSNDVHMNALETVGDYIFFGSNHDALSLEMNSLESTGSYLHLNDNDGLTNVDFGSLEEVGRYVWVRSSENLVDADLRSLVSVGEYLTLDGAENPTNWILDSICSVDGDLVIKGNVDFDQTQMCLVNGQITENGYQYIGGWDVGCQCEPGAQISYPSGVIAESVVFFKWSGNYNLSFLSGIQGEFTIFQNDLQLSVDVSNLATTGDLKIQNNKLLTTFSPESISFPSLREVRGFFRFQQNRAVTYFGASNLEFVRGNADFTNNDDLVEIDLSGLRRVEGDFQYTDNQAGGSLELADIGNLEEVTGSVVIGAGLTAGDSSWMLGFCRVDGSLTFRGLTEWDYMDSCRISGTIILDFNQPIEGWDIDDGTCECGFGRYTFRETFRSLEGNYDSEAGKEFSGQIVTDPFSRFSVLNFMSVRNGILPKRRFAAGRYIIEVEYLGYPAAFDTGGRLGVSPGWDSPEPPTWLITTVMGGLANYLFEGDGTWRKYKIPFGVDFEFQLIFFDYQESAGDAYFKNIKLYKDTSCSWACTAEYDPVCGSDDVTYSNFCELQIAQCEDITAAISKSCDGECPCGGGVGPPAYLSVPDFQLCLGDMCGDDSCSYNIVCIAGQKPDGCPGASWGALRALGDLQSCPTPAVVPPAYLNIQDFQLCLGDMCGDDSCSFTIVCIDGQKPDGCPGDSWGALRALGDLQSCPPPAVMPPAYLNIKDFQLCLGDMCGDDSCSYNIACIIGQKPDACPQDSWSDLVSIGDLQFCPAPVPEVEDAENGDDELRCTTKLDLVLVLDHSTSISREDYALLLDFTVDLINELQLGLDETRVGIVRFSTDAFVEFPLDAHASAQDIVDAVMNFDAIGGNTNIGDAMHLAHNIDGRRVGAADAIILITDGSETVAVGTALPESTEAKEKGWIIFTLGIGDGIDTELLTQMASDPKEDFVFSVDNFDELPHILPTMTHTVCERFDVDVVEARETEAPDSAVVPPAYLSVPDFQLCLGDMCGDDSCSYIIVCIAGQRPDTCPQHSWAALRVLGDLQSCPPPAVLPPAYLSVPEFQFCLGDMCGDDSCSFTLVCIGGQKPDTCRQESWDALQALVPSGELLTCPVEEVEDVEDVEDELRCTTKLDLVLVLDHSTSISRPDYALLLDFTVELIEELQVGLDETRVGIVRFSTDAFVEFTLDAHASAQEIVDAVRDFDAIGGNTNIGDAMHLAHNIEGRRDRAADAIILITDGSETVAVGTALPESEEAKEKGWIIFTLGIGDDIDAELLTQMASDPKEDFVFSADTFDELPQILPTITQTVCERFDVEVVEAQEAEEPDSVEISGQSGDLDYSHVTRIRGSLIITGCDECTIDFSNLSEIGGDFVISSSNRVIIKFYVLVIIGGSFRLENLNGFSIYSQQKMIENEIHLTTLQTIGGNFTTKSIGGLKVIQASGLSSIGEHFHCEGHDRLLQVDLGGLREVGGWFWFYRHATLTRVDLSSLFTVGKKLILDGTDATVWVTDRICYVGGDCEINGQTDFQFYRACTIEGTISMNGFSVLGGWNLDDCSCDPASPEPDISLLRANVNSLSFRRGGNFDLSFVRSISGSLDIDTSADGDFSNINIDLSNCESIRDDVSISGKTIFINLRSLDSIGNGFSASSVSRLTITEQNSVDLPALQTCGGNLKFLEVGAGRVSFPILRSVGGHVHFSRNPTLADCRFDSLREVSSYVHFDANDKLKTGRFMKLWNVRGNLVLDGSGSNTNWQMEHVCHIDGDLTIQGFTNFDHKRSCRIAGAINLVIPGGWNNGCHCEDCPPVILN